MWELIKDILTSPFGSFASVLSVFGLAFWAAVKVGGYIEKFRILDKLEASIDKIKDDLSIIKAYMDVSQAKNDPFSKRESPINLNDKGVKVSSEIEAAKIINRTWERISISIKSRLVEMNDANSYTIQEVCFDIGKSYSKYFDAASMENIKTYAFKEGYNLVDFDLLFGIEIRNRYFQEGGLSIGEIDVHDPAKS